MTKSKHKNQINFEGGSFANGHFVVDWEAACEYFGWDKNKHCPKYVMALGDREYACDNPAHKGKCPLHKIPMDKEGKPFAMKKRLDEMAEARISLKHGKDAIKNAMGDSKGKINKDGVKVFPKPNFG